MIYVPPVSGIRPGLFVSSLGKETQASGFTIQTPGSGVLSTNLAYIVRFFLSQPTVIRRFFWANGATAATNNVHVGIYNDDLSTFLLGTATLAAGVSQLQFDNVTDTPIGAGRYWMALSVSGTTTTVLRLSNDANRGGPRYQMASAHPLPATLVPAASTSGVQPLFGFTAIA